MGQVLGGGRGGIAEGRMLDNWERGGGVNELIKRREGGRGRTSVHYKRACTQFLAP